MASAKALIVIGGLAAFRNNFSLLHGEGMNAQCENLRPSLCKILVVLCVKI